MTPRKTWRAFARKIKADQIYRYRGRTVQVDGQPIRVRIEGRLVTGWVHLRSLSGRRIGRWGIDQTHAIDLEQFSRLAVRAEV